MMSKDPYYLVRGAVLRCECGSAPRKLNLPLCHGVYILNQPMMNADDYKANVNIMHFGTCSETGGKCEPQIFAPWFEAHEKTLVDGVPAITTDSFLVCGKGGLIAPETSGQEMSNTQPSVRVQEARHEITGEGDALNDAGITGNDVIIADWISARGGSTYWDSETRTVSVNIHNNKITFQEGTFHINPDNDRAYMKEHVLNLFTHPTYISAKKFPGRLVAGIKGGAIAWVKSYDIRGALAEIALSPALAYTLFVENGTLVVGLGGKIASKAIPVVGTVYFIYSDGGTFVGGFRDAWNEYE